MLELNLQDQVALVTGGSEGIGKAIAYKLAEEGCKIAICARRTDVLEATAAQIRDSTGARVLAVAADVTRLEDLERVVSTTLKTCGPVDILVNNAGRSAAHSFEQTTEEIWQEDFELKFWAAVCTARLVVPHMKTLGRGAIVNITHPGGKSPGSASVPTSVSRAAGIAFTKALSKDLAAHRIRVNTVCLTNIKSAQGERAWRTSGGTLSYEEWCAKRGQAIPLGRLGEASEVADLVAFLTSERAAFITGTAINIDGGESATT